MMQATTTQEETHGEPIIVIRPSFKKLCDGDSCRAALFNHILYWIAKKRKQGIDYWYSTGDGLYHDLAETWGVTIVRREVKALVNSGLIGEMKNPRMGIDRTKHFFFHAEQTAIFFAKCAVEKICCFCIGLAKEVIDLLKVHLTNLLNACVDDGAFDSSVKCLCPKHQGHLIDLSKQLIELSKPFDRFIKAITQVSYSGLYSEESVISSESVNEHESAHVDSDARHYEEGYPDQTQTQLAGLQACQAETIARSPFIAPSLELTVEQMEALGLSTSHAHLSTHQVETTPLQVRAAKGMTSKETLAREMFRLTNNLLSATKAQLPATLTIEQWIATLDYFDWKCAYCQSTYEALEHFIPIRKGPSSIGGTTQANCVPTCPKCNTIKQERFGKSLSHEMRQSMERVRLYLENVLTMSPIASETMATRTEEGENTHDTDRLGITGIVPDSSAANGDSGRGDTGSVSHPSRDQSHTGEQAVEPPQKPVRRSAKKALEEIAPLPAPTLPSENATWNVPTLLKVADHYRGYALVGKKADRAKQGAIAFIQRGKTRTHYEQVYRYMACLDRVEDAQGTVSGLFDEWWFGKEVDVWHVNEHCDVKLREFERKRREQADTAAKATQPRTLGGLQFFVDLPEYEYVPRGELPVYGNGKAATVQHKR